MKTLTSNPFFCASMISLRGDLNRKRTAARRNEEAHASIVAKAVKKERPLLEILAEKHGFSAEDLATDPTLPAILYQLG